LMDFWTRQRELRRTEELRGREYPSLSNPIVLAKKSPQKCLTTVLG
jgi:hypothetical protein